MARPYFRQVPNFQYVSRESGKSHISEYVTLKNLFKRGKLREDIFGNLSFFEKYKIIGNERPDNIAYKFYGDETLDWVILLSNNILHIQNEWPLPQQAFDEYLIDKYDTYENIYSVHHYETTEIRNSLGIQVLSDGLQISPTWKTSGNFIEINNSKIENIYAGDGNTATNTITVELVNGILGLEVGTQINVANVSNSRYNGQHLITEILESSNDIVTEFQFEVSEIPSEATPPLNTPRIEEVNYTIPEGSTLTGNSHYYEYWDDGLEYSVQIPSTSFIREVTNYEYESQIEENKRNIFVLKPTYLNVIFNDLDEIMPYKESASQYLTRTLKRADNIRIFS